MSPSQTATVSPSFTCVDSERYKQTLSVFDAFIVEFDHKGQIDFISDSWYDLLFKSRDKINLVGLNFFDLIDDQAEKLILQSAVDDLLRSLKTDHKIRTCMVFPDKDRLWVDGKLFATNHCLQSQPNKIRVVLRDVTETVANERMIEHMAYYDSLTGLPNKFLLEEKLVKCVNKSTIDGNMVAVGFAGLDNFKQINNTLGHKLADRLIFLFAKRLMQSLPPDCIVARWHGDIFAIIKTGINSEQELRGFGRELGELSDTPINFQGNNIYILHSVGFSIYPLDGKSIEELLIHAEKAMLKTKENGRNNFMFYSDIATKEKDAEKLTILNKLTAAVRGNRIEAFLQPKVDIQQKRIIGMEALARWHDENLGWISPAIFIPEAEKLGLIDSISAQVIHQSFSYLGAINRSDLKLAVNISLQQLLGKEYDQRLLILLERFNLYPEMIILEITESMAMLELDKLIERIRRLKEIGFQISIDDFGTGFSSLSRLYQMPVDELKIDMSFIKRILHPEGQRIVQAIVQIAKAMNLRLVAEGVENIAELEQLAKMGVHIFQGYYFAKPMSYDNFVAFLTNYKPE